MQCDYRACTPDTPIGSSRLFVCIINSSHCSFCNRSWKENDCLFPVAGLKEYVPYVYFEHSCVRGKLQTDKMCRYYKKGGKLYFNDPV